jgi:hypothetical protein
MRTTVQLDDDVTAALERLREAENIGVSEALNRLVRMGLAAPKARARFTQRSEPLGLRIGVDDIAEALELLEGPAAR